MIAPIVFAGLENFARPEMWLAIVGGAAVGAFVSGLLAQLLCRAMTKRKLPPIPTLLVRVVGGVLLGALTAMWVWQGGGFGPGGPGGPGGLTGTPGPLNANPDKDKPPSPKPPDQPTDKDKPPPPKSNVLRVEVLPDAAVRQVVGEQGGEQAVKDKRFYRVEGETRPQDLLALPDMKKRIHDRLGEQPPLTEVDVVTRPGSPDITAGRVNQLRDVIHDLDPHIEVKPVPAPP